MQFFCKPRSGTEPDTDCAEQYYCALSNHIVRQYEMATARQQLGAWGEKTVARTCECPQCKRPRTLRRLPPNFKCADLICDFCGYLAQVKAVTVDQLSLVPKQLLGAAWGPQKQRMDAGIYFPLFLVLKKATRHAIYYLPSDLQSPACF